jgi:GTP-binding protein Era
VGRPNVGKSTLLNKLLGQKISITSRKAQTTRHRIVGIHTEGPYQAIYVDTPGLHMEEKRAINRLMNKAASSSIGDVELVIFVVEGTRWTQDDEMVLNKLRDAKAPVILAVNKVDNVQEKADLLPHLQFLASQMNFLDIVPISAETGPTSIPSRRSCVSICRKRSITSRKIILPIVHSALWPPKSSVKN